jgi:hypothetical protein
MAPEVDEVGLAELYQGLAPEGDHPDDNTWVAFSTGALDTAKRLSLADHVVTCAACAGVYRAVRSLRERAPHGAVAGLADRASTPWVRSRPATWLAAAATVALAATAAMLQFRTPSSPASDPAVVGEPTSPGPGASTAPVESPRAWALNADAPAVQLPARYALVVRGADAEQAFMKAFGQAIGPYREGRYAEAAAALEPVAREFSRIPEAAFYLGVARLLAGDATGAREPLDRARLAETLGESARWYQAVAAERLGDRQAADGLLRGLCDGAGEHRDRACAALTGSPAR